jgi:group I intron endonuclease
MITYTIDTLNELGKNHCGIYLITNTINNKQYVGQSIDILSRWSQHEFSNASSDLYTDIKKYGLINFMFQVLEECSPRNLDEKEYFWINELDTYNNGYNNTQGNISSINRLIESGIKLELLPRSEVEAIKSDLYYYQPNRISFFQDYDYIHGTDNPIEIDGLISQINNSVLYK